MDYSTDGSKAYRWLKILNNKQNYKEGPAHGDKKTDKVEITSRFNHFKVSKNYCSSTA